jgi:hypothetical protein
VTDYKVAMAFESLGENCEVGLVQRHFGAEPLGLLRFSALDIADLVAAVQEDFAGVGDPAQTRLCASPHNGEYYSLDEKFRINSHGLIFSADVAPKAAHATICRRATFLRIKLLQDLRDGSKIFIFKTTDATPEALVVELFAALRRHGPVTLLWVRPSTDATEHGRVSWLADGLMGGYLDRVCNIDGDWNISYAMWIKLLRRALKLANDRPSVGSKSASRPTAPTS